MGTTGESWIPLECEVEVKEGKATQTAAFQLMLRRASYILQDVDVHPVAIRPTASVTVRVKTLDFEYGVPYELKVAGGTGCRTCGCPRRSRGVSGGSVSRCPTCSTC